MRENHKPNDPIVMEIERNAYRLENIDLITENEKLRADVALLNLNNSTLSDMVDEEQKHYVTMRQFFEGEIAKLKSENDKLCDQMSELLIESLHIEN